MTQNGVLKTIPPPCMWAQRGGVIYLTVNLEDCKAPTIDIEKDKVHFCGIGGSDKKEYEVTIDLYSEIETEGVKRNIGGRCIELILKKVASNYWPRLTKEPTKYHWLKVDFNKWKDEGDSGPSDEECFDDDFNDLIGTMSKDGMDEDSEEDLDESDDRMPDLA